MRRYIYRVKYEFKDDCVKITTQSRSRRGTPYAVDRAVVAHAKGERRNSRGDQHLALKRLLGEPV